jgi:hypothetical protein
VTRSGLRPSCPNPNAPLPFPASYSRSLPLLRAFDCDTDRSMIHAPLALIASRHPSLLPTSSIFLTWLIISDRYRHIFHSDYRFGMSDYFDSGFPISILDRPKKYENRNDLGVFLIVSHRFHHNKLRHPGGTVATLDSECNRRWGALLAFSEDRRLLSASSSAMVTHGLCKTVDEADGHV